MFFNLSASLVAIIVFAVLFLILKRPAAAPGDPDPVEPGLFEQAEMPGLKPGLVARTPYPGD